MPSKIIHEVRSIARSDRKTMGWGAFRTRAEADARLAQLTTNKVWANQYHEHWWIEEVDTTGCFDLPSVPKPRDRYSTKTTEVSNGPGRWSYLDVEVLDQSGSRVAKYLRTHSGMYQTFEPFRQGDRMFALVSIDYTATSVLDLTTGEVIAGETPHSNGFCPVGFYVPDWYDLNDGSILPGSLSWRTDYEQPKGDFGFVWGCIWGDDSSWKVQYLDLSRVQQGELRRDDRFGYVELADQPSLKPSDFIQVSFWDGQATVTFAVLSRFDLKTGKASSE